MTISLRQFEFIMRLVIEWANDVPFETWFKMLMKVHRLHEIDIRPDYQIILVNGEPYLYDTLLGGTTRSWHILRSWYHPDWPSLPAWTEPSLDGDISERSNLDEIE